MEFTINHQENLVYVKEEGEEKSHCIPFDVLDKAKDANLEPFARVFMMEIVKDEKQVQEILQEWERLVSEEKTL
jgi:hypothetical protein